MILRFPFTWGAPSTVPVTPTVTSAETWTRVYASGANWVPEGAGLLPRFNHIHGLVDVTVWTKDNR